MSALPSCAARVLIGAGLAVLLVAPGAAPVAAQELSAEDAASLGLRAGPRQLLSRLQGGWLEWLTAVNVADAERAEAAVDDVLAYAQQAGMRALPELSLAASVRAVEAARAQDPQRADIALRAAERLDPARPEVAFAGARVSWLSGAYLDAVSRQLRGYARAWALPFERELLLNTVGGWALRVLVVALLMVIALNMAIRGPLLYRDVLAFVGRYVPLLLGHALALGVLIWPLLLPGGLYWLAFYWPLLLWSYGGRAERALFLLAWLSMAATPLLLDQQARHLRGALQPALRSVEDASRGRLSGSLLNDVSDLRAALPESAAVDHLLADLQRLFEQCDIARSLYRSLLERESANAAALNDLGFCHFESGSFERAIESFTAAAASDPASAIAQFNLSRTHSELYRFSESELALREARRIDSELVTGLMRREGLSGIVPWNGGLQRAGEVRAELSKALGATETRPSWDRVWSRSLFLPLVVLFSVVAFGVRFLIRSSGGRVKVVSQRWLADPAELWRRTLLPGLSEAESGAWIRAFLMLLLLIGLLALPDLGRAGLSVPWGLDPGPGITRVAAVAGLVLLFGYRCLRRLAGSR